MPQSNTIVRPAKQQRLHRNVLVNAISIAVPMLVAVFAIPRIIAGMGMARFGILSLGWIIIGYSGMFDLGLGRALTKFVAERIGTDKERELPNLVFTANVLMVVFGAMGGLLVVACAPFVLFHWIHIPLELRGETYSSIYVIAGSLPVVVVTAGLRGVLEAAQRFDLSGGLRTALGLFNFISPLLVLPFTRNLSVILLVLVAGRVVVLLAHFVLCIRFVPGLKGRSDFDRGLVRPLLAFGSSSTVSSIAAPLITALDRFVVGARISVLAVPYYASPSEITSRVALFPNALVGVLFPAFSARLANGDQDSMALFRKSGHALMALMFPTSLGMVAFSQRGMELWLGHEFALKSNSVLQLLAIAVFSNSFGLLAFTLIQSAGRPDLCAKLNVAELLIYTPFLWHYTLKYGVTGTAALALVRVALDTAILLALCAQIVPNLRPAVVEIFVMFLSGVAVLVIATIPMFQRSVPLLFSVAMAASAIFAWRVFQGCLYKEDLLRYLRRASITGKG